MTLLKTPLILALGWTLIHFLWQGLLVALATGVALRSLRNASAEARYLAACLGMVACLVLPTVTLAQLWPPSEAQILQNAPRFTAKAPAQSPQIPSSTPDLGARIERAMRPALPWIVAAWLAGCGILLLRLGGGWLWLNRLRQRQSHPAPREWQHRLEHLSHLMGLKRSPRLRLSTWVEGPIVQGWWKPAILMPASLLTGMNPELLEALLAHELAHIRRQDYLANLLQSLCETLLFYHPAVWWISAKIRSAREEACDDLAAKTIGEPRRLALALAELDLFQLPAPALGAHQGDLMHRIQRLVNPSQPRPLMGSLLSAALAASLLSPMMASSAPPTEVLSTKNILRPAELVAQIDTLAAKEGIDPNLLRAMAEAESAYNPAAVSRMGSTGILQVMPATALKYGATDLTDRSQVAAAGARYLRFLLDRYQGDWAKAVAAYNVGEVAFDAGKLNPETPGYVAKVLALASAKAVQPVQAEGERASALAPAWLEALPPAKLKGELSKNAEGAWLLNLHGAFLHGGNVEVRAEGEAKPLGVITWGSTEANTSRIRGEASPKVLLPAPPKGRKVTLRATEQGTGRWGEITLQGDAGGGVMVHWDSLGTFKFDLELAHPKAK